ncbi:DNA adenine methylase [Campylobacter jejuni]|uniref:site-specific DNA-methyltransferase (adenine-specific) n=1 Tax=Campylobacter jejuni TaxID=197 RepID=A0AB36G070_CAMJU|nr:MULTISPECIES: DNA adenine methylase [Campylobacter]GJJ32572.1 restriction endonuclease subunit M [Escherichia coli]HEF9735413.1 DNA adenine methylase [Campylobacter coli]ALV95969.1 modification methylase [Campylobacter jejuni]ALV97567.1 modification methylase [Campylobacter jejuni]ALV99148.1 modification methylase [Campylobacter jejuni]
MNYIGSKVKLLDFLFESINDILAKSDINLEQCTFIDLFAGTSAVGKKFKNKVEKVISNDKEFYSFVLAKNYIENTVKIKRSKELIKELNNIAKINPIKGKIYKHYSLGGGENRQYFSDFNAMKIDSMRIKISEWKYDNFINEKECYFLLASLLESADKVANTASVYGAFLKHLKPSAQKELILLPAEFECTHTKHLVFNENANDLIKKIKGDILYLDPPYNSREYGANYHVLNSIAMYDDFIPQGKTGLRAYEKSAWCKKNLVFDALEDLIKNADFKFIFLSYNDEGLLSLEQIRQIFEKYGKYDFKSQIYQRFKADSKRICQQNKTIEYLHILEKF